MRRLFLGLLGLCAIANASAITVVLDYSHDDGYFATHPEAKSAMEKAASDISDALSTQALATLNAVETDTFAGSDSGLTTGAQIEWDLKLADPANPASEITISDFSLAANEIRIYVGATDTLGGTEALGEGAPASGAFGLGYFEPETPAAETATAEAIQSAVGYSNGILLRGAGPIISSTNSSTDPFPSGAQTTFTVDLGALAGFLTFDKSVNWHFDSDPSSMPNAGEYDFYTVMLHEMLHALGFGAVASPTWNSFRDGTNWTGPVVIALVGSGAGMITAGGGHIADGKMGKILGTNTSQEAVMTPNLTDGERRYLTDLDIAFLRDIGYGPASAAPTPPPAPIPATPTPTPVVESVPLETPIVLGKTKLTTLKSKILLKGTVTTPGAEVYYKVGKGKLTKAKGGSRWKLSVRLKPGKNVILIYSADPVTGELSKPKKVVVKRI